jgi:hypothetical protein
MRALLFLVAALALGCDDSGVQAKVADVLAYGAAEARVACTVSINGTAMTYRAHRLVDGSVMVSLRASDAVELSRFCARDESCAADAAIEQEQGVRTVHIVSGALESIHSTNGVEASYELDTYCAGRNLEAF